MPRYKLRTLMIVLAVGPGVLANGQDNSDPGKALWGEWEIVEMVYRTKVQDFRGRPGGWFVFGPAGFTRLFNEDERDKFARDAQFKKFFTERCIVRSGEIDFFPRLLPRLDERLVKAKYDLIDGKLRIVRRDDDNERPTDFDEAYKDTGLTLFVLKRVK